MYYDGWFWLSCLLTIAVILLSLPVFSKLLKKRGIRSPTAVTAQNTSSASPSASSSASGGQYEVFLSFRGNDTRKGFTDFLYTYLIGVGIRTFRDNNDLRVGEEIGPELLKAIRESKISIPIFSSDYASSKWCLLELAQMVECRKTLGQKILPIFYDVEPSDVRHQTGSYEKAFRQHKKRFNEKTVQGWKEALREVGELKGWELKKETDGHQGELAKMVVEKVLLELKKKYMVVTENLVGIDHHVEKMMEFLNVDSNDMRIVGIHGMGGIGKTTIAKVVYNQLSECFECCCFLADVRETSQTKGLVYLQIQLICKVLKVNCFNIANVDEGINTIEDTICKKKVLIVLDDVDEKSQFDKLAGKCDWYGSGSRIIVTTRNKEVLNGLEVDKTYEPPLMEADHSLQLFSKHAFRRDSPLEDYDSLSREIVSTAAGLPLALEVIGSSLFLEGKEVWNDTLMKLKEIPDEKVQEKLRISYETLDYRQKQIFLDIACLFIGVDERNPFYMWDDCKFYPIKGINVLVRRSLVKIGDDNKFRMHDQLRDLGRQIVREENFNELGECSRLWHHEEALDIMEGRTGTRKVVALCLKPFDSSEFAKLPNLRFYNCFTNKEFVKLPNLRFLQVDYSDLAGDFENLLSNLRWLRWQGCPENFTATNFYLKNLVILDLSQSNITDDWEGWSQIKMAPKLKVLDLSSCYYLTRTLDLSTFTTLERLILSQCVSLDQIDPSIWNLIYLRVLDIERTVITKLPDAIGNLENLEEIDASDCYYLQGEIPSNIGRLSSLRILRLNYTKICSLPVEIVALSRLEHLEVQHCSILKCIPGLPSSLFKLCLVHCSELMEIQGLGKLKLLTSLDVSWCEKLPKLDGLEQLESLTYLNTSYCESLERLPDLSNLSRLKHLEVQRCSILKCIPGLPSSLFKLCFFNFSELMEIQGLGKLELLTSLDISRCGKLTKLDGLEQLESLTYLKTSNCESLERLPDLSNLSRLKHLEVRHCSILKCIPGLPSSLFKLYLFNCSELMEIQGLGKLELLTRLDVSLCGKLPKLDGLEQLESLTYLNTTSCESIERLPDLSNLSRLEHLEVQHCSILKCIPGLPSSLFKLYLFNCSELMEIQGLGKLKLLTSLDVSWCRKLPKLDGLEQLESLTYLNTSNCESLERLPDLSNLSRLEHLEVQHCSILKCIPGLPSSLFKLCLADCSELMEIQGLGKLELLTSLDVSRCRKLPKLDGLKQLVSLTYLNTSNCESLKRLPNLSNLKKLKTLITRFCKKLIEIQGLDKLESLEHLDMDHCISIERLPDLSNLGMLKELKALGVQEVS